MSESCGEALAELRVKLDQARHYLRVDELGLRKAELEESAGSPELWSDPDRARALTQELASINDDLNTYYRLSGELEDAETLWTLAQEEDDASTLAEAGEAAQNLHDRCEALELRALFSGEYDERDAACQIQSGEGGTDSMDWASMLLRMYSRWAERRGFVFEVESVQAGGEAGITSAEFIVRGRRAYGLMRSEHGIHRLVRISPFNKEGKRHTAFSSLKVVPIFPEVDSQVHIEEADLRIDTYRSSGAGGQHVNVTDSAVRVTHLPTGIVTSSQAQRSQHQNKERAMQMLAAKLLDLERRKREEEMADITGSAKKIGFGSQIRSYVLQPFQLVKDLRSDYSTSNVEATLDGDIEEFMLAYLQWQKGGGVT